MKEKIKGLIPKIKIEFKKLKINIEDSHKYAFFSAIILGLLLHFSLYSQQITTDGLLY